MFGTLDADAPRFLRCLDYAAGERAFIVLSFFAKTLLAWIGFGGVYRRY